MLWLLSSYLILWAGTAQAVAVIETIDRLEINWSTLRVRFYGEANGAGSREDTLKATEKKAWQDGLDYLRNVPGKISLMIQEPRAPEAQNFELSLKDMSKALAKSTSSFNTTYFADGTVRVTLENQLPKALVLDGIRFRQREPVPHGALEYSGIGLRLSKSIKPSARYVVVDENEEILFSVQDMAEESYKKNLMGRWLRRPTDVELSEIIGKSPAVVEVQVVSEAKLRVARADWNRVIEGHQALLVNGVVALILP